jgi:hypothetical protein
MRPPSRLALVVLVAVAAGCSGGVLTDAKLATIA